MSEKIHALTVTFGKDLSAEEIEPLIQAIKQMPNVTDVTPMVADDGIFMARSRAKRDLAAKLWKALED